jgi:hypothetical protein
VSACLKALIETSHGVLQLIDGFVDRCRTTFGAGTFQRLAPFDQPLGTDHARTALDTVRQVSQPREIVVGVCLKQMFAVVAIGYCQFTQQLIDQRPVFSDVLLQLAQIDLG